MLQGVILNNIVDFINIVYIRCLQYFSFIHMQWLREIMSSLTPGIYIYI